VLGEKIMEEKIVNASVKEINVSRLKQGFYFVKAGEAVGKFCKQ
jgi:hypothetical protein